MFSVLCFQRPTSQLDLAWQDGGGRVPPSRQNRWAGWHRSHFSISIYMKRCVLCLNISGEEGCHNNSILFFNYEWSFPPQLPFCLHLCTVRCLGQLNPKLRMCPPCSAYGSELERMNEQQTPFLIIFWSVLSPSSPPPPASIFAAKYPLLAVGGTEPTGPSSAQHVCGAMHIFVRRTSLFLPLASSPPSFLIEEEDIALMFFILPSQKTDILRIC